LEGLCRLVLHLPSIPLEQDVVEVVEDEVVVVVVQVLDVTEN
jgi:hypothetical protein